jgi:hypothetical protein
MSDSNLLRDKLRSHLAKQRDLMRGQMKDPSFIIKDSLISSCAKVNFSSLDLYQQGSTFGKSDIATRMRSELHFRRALPTLKATPSVAHFFLCFTHGTWTGMASL